MRHPHLSNLRNILGDTRGASILSYALLLGGIAVALIYGVRQVSTGLTTSLTNQAADLQAIADGTSGSSDSGGTTGGSSSGGTTGSSSGSGSTTGSSSGSGSTTGSSSGSGSTTGSSSGSGSGSSSGKGNGKNNGKNK